MHICQVCGSEWSSILVAEECCDPAYDDMLERGRE